jgi:hypothetical protein
MFRVLKIDFRNGAVERECYETVLVRSHAFSFHTIVNNVFKLGDLVVTFLIMR